LMNALLFQNIYWPKGICPQTVQLLLLQLSAHKIMSNFCFSILFTARI
jgi:hypothetical protein